MSAEQYECEVKFYDLRSRIQNLAESLHFKPSLDFERMVINDDSDASFAFSDENIEKVEEFYEILKAEDKKIAEKLREIREQLHSLWSILHEERAKRERFLEINKGNSYDNLNIFEIELNRCLAIKKENFKVCKIVLYFLHCYLHIVIFLKL